MNEQFKRFPEDFSEIGRNLTDADLLLGVDKNNGEQVILLASRVVSLLLTSASFSNALASESSARTQAIATAVTNLKNDLLGGASAAFDTFKELQTLLENDAQLTSTILTSLAGKTSSAPLAVTGIAALDRVDLQNGIYNVSGKTAGVLLVSREIGQEEWNLGQELSVLQVLGSSSGFKMRRISLQNNPIEYPDWVSTVNNLQLDYRMTQEVTARNQAIANAILNEVYERDNAISFLKAHTKNIYVNYWGDMQALYWQNADDEGDDGDYWFDTARPMLLYKNGGAWEDLMDEQILFSPNAGAYHWKNGVLTVLNKGAIDTAIAALKNQLLNGAGPAFDTLKELQQALGNDANFATTILNAIASEATTRGNADTSLGQRIDALLEGTEPGTNTLGKLAQLIGNKLDKPQPFNGYVYGTSDALRAYIAVVGNLNNAVMGAGAVIGNLQLCIPCREANFNNVTFWSCYTAGGDFTNASFRGANDVPFSRWAFWYIADVTGARIISNGEMPNGADDLNIFGFIADNGAVVTVDSSLTYQYYSESGWTLVGNSCDSGSGSGSGSETTGQETTTEFEMTTV